MNDAKNDKKNDAPDGEALRKEIEELQDTDADPETGRAEPGDGSAGATGPGGGNGS